MAGRARWFVVLPVVSLLPVLVGCSKSCAGPSGVFPNVAVDVGPWLKTHRDATVRVCLDDACQAAPTSAGADDVVQLYLASGQSVHSVMTLTVTANRSGRQVLRTSTSVQLHEHSEHGACGTISWWSASLALSPTGRLH